MKLNIKILFVFVVISSDIYAQEREIRGVVTIFDSIPLIGVNVKAKNTKQVVITDSLGRFSISCVLPDVLNVSAKGFFTQKARLTTNIKFAAVNLRLKPVAKRKEYDIGYGHISEKDKLYAISMVDEDDMNFSQYLNVFDIISGRFPGVVVENGKIQVRGEKSFTLPTPALIVLDGVTVDPGMLESLPTSQIKSINIIKDAGGSIYGVQGANGVVLIETKPY